MTPVALFRCGPCGKLTYKSRRDARRLSRDLYPGEHMSAYRCPCGSGFHIGHLPRMVVNGDAPRSTLRRRVS